MTLIIGVEDTTNGHAIIAGDSGAWKGDQADTLRTSKIWRSNGWVAGLSGTMAQSQRVRMVDFPSMKGDESRDEAEAALLGWGWQALEAVADVNERIRRADDQEHPRSPALVVAWRFWCWYVIDGEATSVSRGWTCAGASDYGTGALSALWGAGRRGARLAEEAAWAVAEITEKVRGPFRWMTTTGEEGIWE